MVDINKGEGRMTIKQRQNLLAYLGYYVGAIDGIWGTLSKTATKAFQKDFGLTADGVCGEDTEKALKHSVCYGIVKNVETEEVTTKEETGTLWDGIKYFKQSEFTCKCGCGADDMNETLIRVADRVREYFDKPIRVSSGRRCSKHNTNVGGVSNSRHLSGKAMDFSVSGKTATQVLAYVQKQPEIRYAYAIDGSYVHMDVE
jgi:hypothetical protein